MLETILIVAAGLVSGVVIGLKVIAPRTATTVDDEVLEKLKALEELLQRLSPTK